MIRNLTNRRRSVRVAEKILQQKTDLTRRLKQQKNSTVLLLLVATEVLLAQKDLQMLA